MLCNAQPQGLSIEAILLLKYVHVQGKSCLFRADWSRETIPALHVPRSYHELESIKCIIIDVSLMLLFVLNLQHAEHRVAGMVCCVTTSLIERNHHTALQLSTLAGIVRCLCRQMQQCMHVLPPLSVLLLTCAAAHLQQPYQLLPLSMVHLPHGVHLMQVDNMREVNHGQGQQLDTGPKREKPKHRLVPLVS